MNHAIDQNDLIHALERTSDMIVGATPCPVVGGKINPHVTTFFKENGQKMSVFHVKPIYYETLQGYWRPLTEICSHVGNHKVVMEQWSNVHPRYIHWLTKRMELIGGELLIPSLIPSSIRESVQLASIGHIGLTTLTAYPDPSPESTTVDGLTYQGYAAPGQTWATIHGAGGTAANDSGTNQNWGAYLDTGGSGAVWRQIYKGHALFDTSSISTDDIDDATLSVKQNATAIVDNHTASIGVSASSPASNTALAASDYANATSTTQYATTVALSTISTSTYFDLVFNASGEASIAKTGISKYALRLKGDIDNVEPTTANAWSYTTVHTAEASGTGDDPKLVVNHSAGGGGAPTPTLMLMGIGA